MKLLDAPEAWGYTIFCDDIRAEVGGKLTYVGCYMGGRMLVPGPFPFTLQKLALSVTYSQKFGEVVHPNFWIFFPGDAEDKPSLVIEVPQEASEKAFEDSKELAKKLGSHTGVAVGQFYFALTGTVIQRPGLIRVRAVRDDQLVRLGTLEILLPEGYGEYPPEKA